VATYIRRKIKKNIKLGMETEVMIKDPSYQCSYVLSYSLFLDTQRNHCGATVSNDSTDPVTDLSKIILECSLLLN
jgi:hypothetical protein